ncbi:cobalt transport ATP-binding protein [Vulcanisaeta moutnovskia 768-28]|uniref:Cobalt transport ATP-binding protein n=1 Tax=Vulcanisaeta moutnovskia (strain 768-28) TaxID=985053 RepID=F0QWR3_VULM7|nr:energy-coupling factor transporter ATPase [Vulcanisaeta moutnovskia]ADY02280.1 cobalt transport ATP-binding protein [Vulcanisaeta moutnovskia 768-28]
MAKIIKINNLFVRYFGSDKPVLRGLSLEIEEGEFVLLVGRTGSGKSTLLNVINGVIPNIISATVRGSVNVANHDPRKTPVHEMATIVGTVYQIPESQIFSLIVDDDVAFGLENRAIEPEEMRRRVIESLKLVNLTHKMKHPTFLLSGGEKQRLVIAGVLAVKPRILILDEPTSMLDSVGAEQIFGLVKKLNDEGLTIIMSEHRVERVIGMVDRIIGLKDGVIYIDDEPHKAVAKDLTKLGIEEPQVTTLYRMINKNSDYYPISVEEFLEIGVANKLEIISRREDDNNTTIAVSVNSVRFTYPGSTQEVLKGVNLEIRDGEVVSVIGPNGSGKSTLMYLLAGIYRPSTGYIQVFGRDSTKLIGKDRVRLIGYVFQDPDQMLLSSTVKGELEFTLKLADIRGKEAEDRIKRITNYLNISDLLDQSPHKLSVGQRRLVSVASVLVAEPRILILDEPTRGLDNAMSIALMDLILTIKEERGMTLIMVTHNMRQVGEYSDKAFVMYDGTVAFSGTPEEVFEESHKHPEWGISPPQVFEVTRSIGKPTASMRRVRANVA